MANQSSPASPSDFDFHHDLKRMALETFTQDTSAFKVLGFIRPGGGVGRIFGADVDLALVIQADIERDDSHPLLVDRLGVFAEIALLDAFGRDRASTRHLSQRGHAHSRWIPLIYNTGGVRRRVYLAPVAHGRQWRGKG